MLTPYQPVDLATPRTATMEVALHHTDPKAASLAWATTDRATTIIISMEEAITMETICLIAREYRERKQNRK